MRSDERRGAAGGEARWAAHRARAGEGVAVYELRLGGPSGSPPAEPRPEPSSRPGGSDTTAEDAMTRLTMLPGELREVRS
ncbi:hypothetical protein, partial [Streptomyces sp. NPDC056983]|uniref:hypothetical protein n=1 Tax=Streptomyces sp. NPDC056983 TaxID=3345987 RepID=UPI003627522C